MNDFQRLFLYAPPCQVKAALSKAELAEAAAQVEPEPSEAQKESGNYKKGHIVWKGLPITIETAKAGFRSGVTKAGQPWKTKMTAHYGYIKQTESEADGDHVDIFLAEDDLDSEIVFIINQVEPTTGKFDEHKLVAGVTSADRARELYHENYQKGWKGFDSVVPITIQHLKWWLANADTSKPIEAEWARQDLRKKAAGEVSAALSLVPEEVDEAKDHHRYKCPHCGEDKAYNGIPGTGTSFRGSVVCTACGKGFAACAPGSKKYLTYAGKGFTCPKCSRESAGPECPWCFDEERVAKSEKTSEIQIREIGSRPCAVHIKYAAPRGKRPFYVAVDLDGTIAEEDGEFDKSRIGPPRAGIKEWLEKFREAGAKIIVYTCRSTDNDQVTEYMIDNELPFDYVNENPDQPPDTSDKLFADVYWDNRAIDASDLDSGEEVLRRIEEKANDGDDDASPALMRCTTIRILIAPQEILDAINAEDD